MRDQCDRLFFGTIRTWICAKNRVNILYNYNIICWYNWYSIPTKNVYIAPVKIFLGKSYNCIAVVNIFGKLNKNNIVDCSIVAYLIENKKKEFDGENVTSTYVSR